MDYKKKNIILLITVIISFLLIYWFTISKTISYRKEYKTLQKEKEEFTTISGKIMSLKKQSIYLDSILSKENISITNSFQQILLKKINTFKAKNPIEIIEFDNPLNVQENDIKIQLYPIIIKGDFNALLAFLNFIESQGLAEIKNFKFLKKKNYSTRKDYLLLEIYLKKIIEKV